MSKGSGWQRNRVGPYQVLRKVAGIATDKGLGAPVGRLFTGVHTATGRPALLVGAFAPEHYAPRSEWRVRVRAGTAPDPYVALEVERAPEGEEPLRQMDDAMDALACALERLGEHPEVAAHLCTPAAPPPPPRRTLPPLLGWLAMGAVLAAVALTPRAWRAAQPSPGVPAQEARAAAAEEALAEPEALPVGTMEGRALWQAVALDMPKRPFPGQYRVDKDGKCKGRLEVPINGGCWVGLDLKAPCGDDAYEWQGKCYWPSAPAAKEPSSTLPRPPPVPAQRSTP